MKSELHDLCPCCGELRPVAMRTHAFGVVWVCAVCRAITDFLFNEDCCAEGYDLGGSG